MGAAVSCFAACTNPQAPQRSTGLFDPIDDALAGDPDEPQTPLIDALPERVPYLSIPLSGRARNADRVVVEQSDGRSTSIRLSLNGGFCTDVKLLSTGLHRFVLQSHSDGGSVSRGRTVVEVVVDRNAPRVDNLYSCLGTSLQQCAETEELCHVVGDEDCSGRADAEDPACSDCSNPRGSPNPENVQILAEGTHSGLVHCPGTVSYYGVVVGEGATVEVSVSPDFTWNPDLALIMPGGDGVLETSRKGVGETDRVRYRVPEGQAGIYVIQVGAPSPQEAGTYSLTISI